ncbi:transporter substrate-binding domain-containing protein [Litorilituus sediminis]|uniref:Transporter substrate-binding domain-containing protein n=1 Tax=Litorilituus sediminis TaxID=718192 RepID=A0A4P6PC73_9GAMM|nr:transporter substrate-binding domain-containing protein [Litorilituus sediminis]
MFNKEIILACFLFCAPFHCLAEKISVAFGNTLAPWVMSESQSGILLDIVKQALEPLGYKVKPYYYPYARRINAFRQKEVDVVCDINLANIKHLSLRGHFSGEIYQYENYFYALSRNKFQFSSMDDLVGSSIVAWQGAMYSLDDKYEKMATANPFYMEIHNQKSQVKLLFNGRVDVIQLDKNIFEYYRLQIAKDGYINVNQGVDKFAFLTPNPGGFMFHSQKVRDDFLTQVNKMIESGQMHRIFQQYGGSYQ